MWRRGSGAIAASCAYLRRTIVSLAEACGTPDARMADLVMVTSAGDADAAASAIAALRPDLRAFTNSEAVGQMQQRGFTYFRQISTVLTTITVSFALSSAQPDFIRRWFAPLQVRPHGVVRA